jgi:hypothetical protein
LALETPIFSFANSFLGYWRNFVANAVKIRVEIQDTRRAFSMEMLGWPQVFLGCSHRMTNNHNQTFYAARIAASTSFNPLPSPNTYSNRPAHLST